MAGHRKVLDELVFERIGSAVDCDAVMQLQIDVLNAVARASSPLSDPDRAARRARRLLRRAWRRYGDLVVLTLGDVCQATLPSPG